MSLFNKKAMELPEDFALEGDDLFLEEITSEQFNSDRPKNTHYTIDQAIMLMQSLTIKNIGPRVLGGIVKKTLESFDIPFAEIIDDAIAKEAALQAEFQRRENIIGSLATKLEYLQQQNKMILQELENTVQAREFLQRADIAAEERVAVTSQIKNATDAFVADTKPIAPPQTVQKKLSRKRKAASPTIN